MFSFSQFLAKIIFVHIYRLNNDKKRKINREIEINIRSWKYKNKLFIYNNTYTGWVILIESVKYFDKYGRYGKMFQTSYII